MDGNWHVSQVKQAYIDVGNSVMMRNIKVRTAVLNLLILVHCKETTNSILKST